MKKPSCKVTKKFLAIIVALQLCLSLAPTALAESPAGTPNPGNPEITLQSAVTVDAPAEDAGKASVPFGTAREEPTRLRLCCRRVMYRRRA